MKMIVIKDAREHNLKGVSLKIPRNKLVVFTGVSGSGKSSLVFNTIYAESQRQYIESLGTYVRKRLPAFSRPQAEEIKGISAAIVLDQKRLGRNPRSTVGTVTEIYTYLRLLFSRCGNPQIGDSNYFSFNTPEGMCPVCKGLGKKIILDKNKLFNWGKTLDEGGIRFSEYRVGGRRWNILKASELFEMNKPLGEFSKAEVDKLLFSPKIELASSGHDGYIQGYSFEGIMTMIKRRRLDKRGTGSILGKTYFKLVFCDACQGSRLNNKSRAVKVKGRTLTQLTQMELTNLKKYIDSFNNSTPLAKPIAQKISASLDSLIKIGVGYLSLNRSTTTLSGGESQRVKMARQLGIELIELLYILDEPTVGLHPKDISQLINVLKKLRDKGNTILVVEHDPMVISCADQIIDLGPGGGSQGGKIVFQGTFKQLKKAKTLTSQYLRVKKKKGKKVYRKPRGVISIKKANLYNLKNVSVNIPQKVFVCITGVAGSGKSSLINGVFVPQHPKAIVVDQSPAGRNARSNPATYTGVLGLIRKEFASATGQEPGLFSFNSKGACPKCKGLGYKKIDMHFLDPVVITCQACKGKRYSSWALKHQLKGKSIADVLGMTIAQAFNFFDHQEIKRRLKVLLEIGLDYLELGQPLTTLSGGEAQRIKLASQLHKTGNIYVLDEPTTGMHMADIERLIKFLNKLVDDGNSVIIIEHNLDIVSQTDWIIDLGPEGGSKGGRVIAQGTPREVMKIKHSHTGQYLANYLKGRKS